LDWRLLATVFATVFAAELGDKTQLATLIYASNSPSARWSVFLGSAMALVLSSAVGAFAGAFVGARIDPKLITRIAGASFIVIGIWTVVRS